MSGGKSRQSRADQQRKQHRTGDAELEPELQCGIVRMQRQPALAGPDQVGAAGNGPRRIQTPAEEGTLGDPVAGERPDQQPVPRRDLKLSAVSPSPGKRSSRASVSGAVTIATTVINGSDMGETAAPSIK